MSDGVYRNDDERTKIILMSFDPEHVKILNEWQKRHGFATEAEALDDIIKKMVVDLDLEN